ncbi:hypothetical protein [Rhizobium sp. Leaf386]|uniref:hypothetical protein n=1 Tax=Rhizobium sp. Leaf386 TaxID=1736359 RepID=UPI000715F547|nr:hypothetical protein [Rhizobium sp. Leaf386]KQS90313.1 hypothetical protein ASG50_07610 [Rhizobium sp. Leaf386]
MNDLRPEIARIASAADGAERAQALLECSPSMLMTCEATIRNRLMHAGFREGLSYLDAELAHLRSARRADEPGFTPMAVVVARGRMRRIMLGLPADGQVDT